MDVLGNLQSAWSALNDAASRMYQTPEVGNKKRLSAGNMNAAGAGKAVISTVVNGAMNEHLLEPTRMAKEEAQKRFNARMDRDRHARSGGRVMHQPPVSM